MHEIEIKQPLYHRIWTSDWDRLIKLTAAVGVVFYAIGLIVENLYYNQYPVSEIAVFKPACILTGAWTVALFLLVEFPAAASVLVATYSRRPLPWRVVEITVVACMTAALCAFLGLLLLHMLAFGAQYHIPDVPEFSQRKLMDFLYPHGLLLVWLRLCLASLGFNLILVAMWVLCIPVFGRGRIMQAGFPVITIPCILFMTIMFSGKQFYGFVGIHAGGGRPQLGKLYFSADGQEVYKSIRKQLGWYHNDDAKNDSYPDGVLKGWLIKTESERYIVDFDYCDSDPQHRAKSMSIAIDRKLVSAVTVQERTADDFTDEDCASGH